MKHKESSSPPSLNPWEALFSSATRSQPIISNNANDDVDAKKVSSCDVTTSSSTIMQNNNNTHHHRHMNNKGGYTILIQYSITPKSQRKWALLTSTMNTTNSNNININSNINSRNNTNREGMSLLQPLSTPRSSSGSSASAPYGISGPFVIQQALEVLCNKCNGAVIFVSTLGMDSIFLDINNSVVDQESESYNMKSSIDDDDDNDSDGEDENNIQTLQKKRRNAIHMFQRHGACVDLSSDPFGWELDDGIDNSTQNSNNCTKDTRKDAHGSSNISTYSCAMDKLQSIAMTIRSAAASIESRRCQGQEEQEENMQQPIPIVFESMTPLLNIHGVEKVGVLLKSLGSVNSGTETTTNSYSILSPIVAPILYESIRPSDHRYLEDISDAMLHVSLVGEGSSNPSGSSSSSASSSSTGVISSGVLDLVRRGGSRGLGGKFIRHCIPFHVMRLKPPTAAAATTTNGQFQSSYYWILDHNDDEQNHTENDTVTVKKKVASDNTSNGIMKSDEQVGKEETLASRPRIYMQDDDPEYDDYDEEEDLDDDLDL